MKLLTLIASPYALQLDEVLERCDNWAADVRRLLAKRNSNTRLDKLLAAAALAQRRALAQLDTLWVHNLVVDPQNRQCPQDGLRHVSTHLDLRCALVTACVV